MSLNSQGFIGNVKVFTTDNRGFTSEEIAERALDKIIYVGDRSHPVILEQARAFKDQLRTVLIHYLDEAQQSERVTISAKLRAAGHPQIADMIGEL
jgi:HD superfamily phosphohydrolase YqeK